MSGKTALHGAASYGQLEVAELLLESGAEAAKNKFYGETARDCAVEYNHPAVAALLQ